VHFLTPFADHINQRYAGAFQRLFELCVDLGISWFWWSLATQRRWLTRHCERIMVNRHHFGTEWVVVDGDGFAAGF